MVSLLKNQEPRIYSPSQRIKNVASITTLKHKDRQTDRQTNRRTSSHRFSFHLGGEMRKRHVSPINHSLLTPSHTMLAAHLAILEQWLLVSFLFTVLTKDSMALTPQMLWYVITAPVCMYRRESSSPPAKSTSPGFRLMINDVKWNLVPGLMMAFR